MFVLASVNNIFSHMYGSTYKNQCTMLGVCFCSVFYVMTLSDGSRGNIIVLLVDLLKNDVFN